MPEYVAVNVVNLGHQPVTITSLGWQLGIFPKRYAVQMLHGIKISDTPPIVLTTGEQANFLVPLETTTWLKDMASKLNGTFPRLSARMMRVQIVTSVGKIVTCRLEAGLRNKLVDARRAHAVSP